MCVREIYCTLASTKERGEKKKQNSSAEGNVSFEDENISISAAARLAFPLQWAIQGSGETAERLTAHTQSE